MSLIDRLFKNTERREAYADRSGGQLMSWLRNTQDKVYRLFLENLPSYNLGGNSNLTPQNIQRTNLIASQAEVIFQESRPTFTERLFRRINGLFRQNRSYFDLIQPSEQPLTLNAEQTVLATYGLDPVTGQIIPGSYLDAQLGSNPLSSEIGRLLRSALADPNASLEDVRKRFYTAFVNPSGLGTLERYYYRFVNDLFMQVDRQIQVTTANELGYNHFVYAGTAIRDTRRFCLRRLNGVYTLDFAASWDNQQWAGKIPNVPFLQQQGGYNCRHSLMFVSEPIASQIAEQQGLEINQYRQLV